MARFTDRAFTVATSTNPLVRVLRTRVVPRVLPLALRFDRAAAYGFRTLSQLGIGYRRSPAVQDGQPGPAARTQGRRPAARRAHRPRRPTILAG